MADATTSAPASFAELVARLHADYEHLEAEIATEQIALKRATERRVAVKTELDAARKVGQDLDKATIEAKSVREDAKAALAAAEALIATLKTDDEQRLVNRIAELNADHADVQAALDSAGDDLQAGERELKAVAADVVGAQSAIAEAQRQLADQPAAARRLALKAKEFTRELIAASSAGQALRALVHAVVLRGTLAELEEVASQKAADAVAANYTAAVADLAAARTKVEALNSTVLALRAALAESQVRLDEATARRKTEIEKLYQQP
ncbi:MAG TPA: hypothetical protein PKE42_01935 [Arachnia sp.]|nr:hypothetical protein [Arachnia sp.]